MHADTPEATEVVTTQHKWFRISVEKYLVDQKTYAHLQEINRPTVCITANEVNILLLW